MPERDWPKEAYTAWRSKVLPTGLGRMVHFYAADVGGGQVALAMSAQQAREQAALLLDAADAVEGLLDEPSGGGQA